MQGPASAQCARSSLISDLTERLYVFCRSTETFFERYRLLLLVIWSIGYFLITCYRASRKLFWFDEIFTVYITALPDFGSVWHAFTHGVDFNPPLMYLLTRASAVVFGRGQIGTRLPQIIGFWVFCLCLYRFVAVRTTALTGFISMSFPLLTAAYFYSYEARPHGLVLGFAGLALISWQSATNDARTRFWLLLVLGCSLACALLSHSYAFAIFLPFIMGELFRFAQTRRARTDVLLVLGISASAILVSVPGLGAVKHLMPGFGPEFSRPDQAYLFFYAPAASVLCVTLILVSVAALTKTARVEVGETPFSMHEMGAMAGLLLIPVLTFLAAKLAHTPLFHRYSATTVAGVACLVGISTLNRPTVKVLVLLTIVTEIAISALQFQHGVSVVEPSSFIDLSTSLANFNEQYKLMALDPHRELPIAILDNLEFAPLFLYAPERLQRRLAYYGRPDDWIAQGYMRLQSCCNAPGRVASSNDLRGHADEFLAYGTNRSHDSLEQLKSEDATISIEAISGEHTLYLVRYGF
jgi:hypothetical protein